MIVHCLKLIYEINIKLIMLAISSRIKRSITMDKRVPSSELKDRMNRFRNRMDQKLPRLDCNYLW